MKIKTNLYKANTLMKVTGLTRPILDQWTARGYIKPTYPAKGSGYPCKYTYNDIVHALIVSFLKNRGFSLCTATVFATEAVAARKQKVARIELENKVTIEINVQRFRDDVVEQIEDKYLEDRNLTIGDYIDGK